MVGTILDQRFELCEELGSGGMANIFLAHDKKENRDVAVKILKGRRSISEEYRERFQREYELCAQLSHPNVVKMYHFGKVDEKRSYYAMELLPQQSLEDLVHNKGAQEEKRVVAILRQLCSAFTYIHSLGIIHRDLKPENVLIRLDSSIAITDFGIARSHEQAPLTGTGITMGTPNYISPEVLLGNDADERSDIFALGIIAYELLAGENPFCANALGDVIEKIVSYQPPPISSLREGISELWDPIVNRCLMKTPAGRYASVEDINTDLIALGNSLGMDIEESKPSKTSTQGCGTKVALLLGTAAILSYL